MQPTQVIQQARLSRDRRFDGQFFIGVTSTGIFCRPICPARLPAERNVRYFQLAHQAIDAGFRPCLRCRPDAAPQSWAWQGVKTTVQRALRMVADNPQHSLQQLAPRLGISSGYLRRLFREHVGISAKHYQLYQQLLMAKQLLHESNLPVEQIALACGFNSARPLQANLRKHFNLTARDIRGRACESTPLLQLFIPYHPPYNWPHVRAFLARRAIAAMENVKQQSYARSLMTDHGAGWFKAEHLAQRHGFLVTIDLPDGANLFELLGTVRRILDVDTDSQIIGEHLQAAGCRPDTLVEGLRLPGTGNLFEAGCRAILGQQISLTAATKLVTELVHRYGRAIEQGYVFPTPRQLADADLSFLAMPNIRRQSMQNLARLFVENPLHPINDWLTIKGIGPWTVNYARMRGAGDPDVWLAGDLVVRQQQEICTLQPERATPWRSYLTLQLWSQA